MAMLRQQQHEQEQRLSEQLLQYLGEKLQDPEVRAHLRSGVLEPLNAEIRDGHLDASIAAALARVTMPIIVLVVLLLVMCVVQINLSILSLRRLSQHQAGG